MNFSFTKILLAIVLAVSAVIASGVSGLLFVVWPTGLSDRAIVVTPTMQAQLAQLKAEQKFLPDLLHAYPGAPNESVRAQAQAEVDAVLVTLMTDLPSHARRSFVLKTFKSALGKFDSAESEERDQFLSYLQHMMVIIGVSDSAELFNVWRYGFPYGWMIG